MSFLRCGAVHGNSAYCGGRFRSFVASPREPIALVNGESIVSAPGAVSPPIHGSRFPIVPGNFPQAFSHMGLIQSARLLQLLSTQSFHHCGAVAVPASRSTPRSTRQTCADLTPQHA